jgi:hypothetical protein
MYLNRNNINLFCNQILYLLNKYIKIKLLLAHEEWASSIIILENIFHFILLKIKKL